MTDAAFLACICAAPADDGPRLVYADWLEEQGESDRAELIRVQIALSRMQSRRRFENCTGFFSRNNTIELVTIQPAGSRANRPKVGERIDVTIDRRDKPCDVKSEFFGLLVTDVLLPRTPLPNNIRTEIRLRIDEESVPWDGHPLVSREADLYHSPAIRKASDEFAALFGLTGCFGTDHGYAGGSGPIKWEWRRGFVDSLTLSWEAWHRHAAAVRAAAPITRVELTTTPMIINCDGSDWNAEDSVVSIVRGGRTTIMRRREWPHDGPVTRRLFAAEWPGIDFTLPNSPTRVRAVPELAHRR